MATKRTPRTVYNPPALLWHYPNTYTDSDLRGLGFKPGEASAAVWPKANAPETPTPEQIEREGLRASFLCERCKVRKLTPKGTGTGSHCGGTGYGYDSQTGAVRCYQCCAEVERESMRATGRTVLYLTRKPDAPSPSERGEHWHADRQTGHNGYGRVRASLRAQDWSVSDWAGELSFPVLSIKRTAHNWRNVERVDVWYIFEGYMWHGVNLGDNQILRARRTRMEWRERSPGSWGPHTPRKSRAKPSARRACSTCGKPIEVRQNSRAHLAPVWNCYDCDTVARLSAPTKARG